MFSTVLFRRNLRENYKLLLIFIVVLMLYAAMVITMFDPALGQSLDMMADNMQGVFSAFGMDGSGNTITMEAFLANYLYGFLMIILPLVFIVILTARLVARHVTRGSMCYILSAPHSRGKVIRTQVIFLILLVTAMVAAVCGLCILVSYRMFPGAMHVKAFLLLNAGLLGLLLAISGLCFFFSCLFNDSRKASGVSAAIIILFLLFQMISSVGDRFSFLKYGTPLTLFRPMEMMESDMQMIMTTGGFYLAALILFILSGMLFSKRNLTI